MNRLHDLLESLEAGRFGFDSTFTAGDVAVCVKHTLAAAAQAQCFWLGEIDALHELAIVPEIARLPFDVVWFEGTPADCPEVPVGLLARRQGDRIDVTCWVRSSKVWALMWVVRINETLGDHNAVRASTSDPAMVAGMQTCLYAMRAFCSALACTNVQGERHDPSRAIQKARAKRGKAPLYSYWTLELAPSGPRSTGQGGTHASPRVHLRRGHARQYAPGKYTWVQAHAVGHKHLGVVRKDYAVTPALLSAAGGQPLAP